MFVDEATSIDQMLSAWDKGDSIWSVEMGGLGPGYEQAIQVLIVELVRDLRAEPQPTKESWLTWGDSTVSRIDKDCGGFSGAQVGAAKHIASRILRDGYGGFVERARKEVPDRMIQVSVSWRHVSPSGARTT